MDNLIKEIKCNNCGSTLPYESGRKQFYCSYCGTEILISHTAGKKHLIYIAHISLLLLDIIISTIYILYRYSIYDNIIERNELIAHSVGNLL